MNNLRKDIEKILSNVRASNVGKRINIRMRKGVTGYSVFLDYYKNGQHQYSFYKKKFIGRTDTKIHDDDFIRVVMKERDEQDFQLFENEEKFQLTKKARKADFITYYEEIAKYKNRPQYNGSIKHFKEFSGNKTVRFIDLSPKLFESFARYLTERMSVNTAIGYLDVMRAVLTKAVKEKIIIENPLMSVRLKEVDTEKVFLTEPELKKFVAVDIDKYKETQNAFFFSCCTGLRMSDVLALNFDQIKDGKLTFRQQKTKKVEYFPLSKDALKIIEKQREIHPTAEKVFHKVGKTVLNRQVKLICKKAEIDKKVHFHSGRHSFAIRCLNNGMSIYEVSKFLGHTDIKTTQVYLQFVDEHKIRAIGKLPEILTD